MAAGPAGFGGAVTAPAGDAALAVARTAIVRAYACLLVQPRLTGQPRRGRLVRLVDVTGVSGAGVVADVWMWPASTLTPTATIVVQWRGEHSSTVLWRSLDSLLAVHGHDGLTTIEWADQEGEGTV